MTTIKEYLLANIDSAYKLAVSSNETIKNRAGWLEEVGVGAMTDVTMQTLFDEEDVEGWGLDLFPVYEEVLARKLTDREKYEILDIYFWHKQNANA